MLKKILFVSLIIVFFSGCGFMPMGSSETHSYTGIRVFMKKKYVQLHYVGHNKEIVLKEFKRPKKLNVFLLDDTLQEEPVRIDITMQQKCFFTFFMVLCPLNDIIDIEEMKIYVKSQDYISY